MDDTHRADLLRRLSQAVGRCGEWIAGVVADLEPRSAPIDGLGFPRLAAYFPAPWLSRTRSVTVPRIPMPPLSKFGLPEFVSLEQMATAGVTYGQLCIVHADQATESVHCHELVHAVQWAALGPRDYLLTYGVGLIRHGYAQSPLEVAAFDMQSQFEREVRIPRLVETVTARAREAHREAVDAFRQAGVAMGA